MLDTKKLKLIAKKRLKTSITLMETGDWEMAVYMMGYTLECALKATICKRLRLTKYPEDKISDIKSFFMTHSFDRLLIVSGMEDLFSDRGPADVWYHWGQFIANYQGEWTAMRYETSSLSEKKVKTLYTHLTHTKHGILTKIKKRW